MLALQTQPNSIVWYDSKRKKPFLQLKILRLIGKSGRLSKSMTEHILNKHKHHHREILESYAALKSKGLVTEMNYENPGVGKTLPRGRRRRYYQITDLGFSVLIDEGIDASEFWMTMINYCHYAKAVDSHTIDSFYHAFLSHQLKYKSVLDNGYFTSQLHLFNHMSNNWISNKITANNNETGLSQKIIEVLAISPGLTCNDIAHKINVSEHCVDVELNVLAADAPVYESYFLDQGYDANTILEIKAEILSHNLVKKTTRDQGKEITLSLSLYGVMLVLKMIRLNSLSRIKRLYLLNNYSIRNVIDLIADNYRKSLPLIFGEWHLLKRTLKILSIFNFDMILGMKPIVDDKGIPVLLSGNKEYFDIMTGIAGYSHKQLMEIYDKGNAVYSNFERKIESVSDKLNEMDVLLGRIPSRAWLSGSKLEDAFANEISFHYYLNLNHDLLIPPMGAADYYDNFEDLFSMEEDKIKSIEYDTNSLAPRMFHPTLPSPKRKLFDTLDNSSIIRNALMNWINDCITFHKQTGTMMDKFYNELQGR